MKRTLLVLILCAFAGFSFAQKKAVKDANSAKNKDVNEARELIRPALTNPETATDQETWKTAGDIEYKAFENEFDKEQTKLIKGTGGDEEKMYVGLYNMYPLYITADSLGQLPDSNGKIKNKVRKGISDNMFFCQPQFINGGIYYDTKAREATVKDQVEAYYAKAADFFERYWKTPKLDMFANSQDKFSHILNDPSYQVIKYYAIISAVQAGQHPRAIRLINEIKSEPFIANEVYEESAIYELQASEYKAIGDSIAYVKALQEGALKYPKSKFFTPNLINEFIKAGRTSDALDYLDQAIANDPQSSCDLMSVKAALYADQKNYTDAKASYEVALSSDANCERALEGMGVLYIIQAQDVKEKASQTRNRTEQAQLDKETVELYEKSLPLLEKYRALIKARNADFDVEIKPLLQKLQNVYYNLSMLGVTKTAEYNSVQEELGLPANQ